MLEIRSVDPAWAYELDDSICRPKKTTVLEYKGLETWKGKACSEARAGRTTRDAIGSAAFQRGQQTNTQKSASSTQFTIRSLFLIERVLSSHPFSPYI